MPSFTKFTQAVVFLFAGLAAINTAHSAQAQTETVLYSFTGNSDGGVPWSRLTRDDKGNFYGTTRCGGVEYGCTGYGTVFELSPNGSGGWNETTLYSFCSMPDCMDGHNPLSYVLFDSAGNLYGTTSEGGSGAGCYSNGCGVVFELSPVGTSWTETVIYNFTTVGDGGIYPLGGLIIDPAGNLYGTNASGIVFELSPSDGGWTEQTIYTGIMDYNSIGMANGLTMDAAGNLYGASNYSTFELSPNGSGGWNSTVLHTFTSKVGGNRAGFTAVGIPVLDKAGNIYGTSTGSSWGAVYKLTPKKNGKWVKTVLHAFSGPYAGGDGTSPGGALVIDADGNLYGTTEYGGTYGSGTLFELVAPIGPGNYEYKTLLNFGGSSLDEYYPVGSLIRDSAGNLYGTTSLGGSGTWGIVFEVTGLPAATTTVLTSSANPATHG
jgi:uncharacterized repeat protein (TIGR03803 family)